MARRCPHDIPTFLPSKLRIHRAFLGSSQHFLTAASGTGGHLYLKPTAVRRERKRRVQKIHHVYISEFPSPPHTKSVGHLLAGFIFVDFFLRTGTSNCEFYQALTIFSINSWKKNPSATKVRLQNREFHATSWKTICCWFPSTLSLKPANQLPKKWYTNVFLDVYKQISKNSHASTRTTLYMANAAPK